MHPRKFHNILGFVEEFLIFKTDKKRTMYLTAPLHTRGVLKTTKSGNMGGNFRNRDGVLHAVLLFAIIRC